jgi:hypothetical protein
MPQGIAARPKLHTYGVSARTARLPARSAVSLRCSRLTVLRPHWPCWHRVMYASLLCARRDTLARRYTRRAYRRYFATDIDPRGQRWSTGVIAGVIAGTPGAVSDPVAVAGTSTATGTTTASTARLVNDSMSGRAEPGSSLRDFV